RRYTDNYAEPDVGYQIPLVLLVRDREHLKAVRSPLLRVTRHIEHDPEASAWFDRTFPGWAVHVHERLMSEQDLWHYLSRRLHATGIPLFDGLTESKQSQFLTICSVLRCKAGDRVVRAGDVGQEMFVLLSGAAEVRGKAPDGDEIVLATLGRG